MTHRRATGHHLCSLYLAVFDHLAGPKSFYSFAGSGRESLAVLAPEVWRAQVGQFLSTMRK